METFLTATTEQLAILYVLILCIIVQLPITYSFHKYSNSLFKDSEYLYKTKKGRVIWHTGKVQALAFCGIFAFTVIVFVLNKIHFVAIAAVLIEIVINCYHVWYSWNEKYATQADKEAARRNRLIKQRAAYFIGVVNPAMIYALAWAFIEYDRLKDMF